jgi:allantoin racemase
VRLLYLIVDDLDPASDEAARITAAGQGLMAPGDVFTARPIATGPTEYYESAVGLSLCVPGILQAVLAHQDEHDAILLGCFGDPGLRAARAISRIPVLGGAESATAFVRLVAARYGIVTIMDSDIPEIQACLTQMEVAQQCVGIRAVGLPFHELIRDPEDTLARATREAGQLLAAGAQALVLGCMSFGPYPFARELSARLGVPVIDPLRAGVAAAGALRVLEASVSRRWVPTVDDLSALTAHVATLPPAYPDVDSRWVTSLA